MITENPWRNPARVQKKDEAKLAIIRDYMVNWTCKQIPHKKLSYIHN
jgi:hypothetical protein